MHGISLSPLGIHVFQSPSDAYRPDFPKPQKRPLLSGQRLHTFSAGATNQFTPREYRTDSPHQAPRIAKQDELGADASAISVAIGKLHVLKEFHPAEKSRRTCSSAADYSEQVTAACIELVNWIVEKINDVKEKSVLLKQLGGKLAAIESPAFRLEHVCKVVYSRREELGGAALRNFEDALLSPDEEARISFPEN